MSEHADLVRDLVAAGLRPELVARVSELAAEVAAIKRRRASDAERQKRARTNRHVMSRDITARPADSTTHSEPEPAQAATASKNVSTETKQTKSGYLFLSSSSFSGSPTEVQQTEEEQVEARDTTKNARPSLFDQFYELFPNKVGKEAARKAFAKVVSRIVSFDVLMAGLARYVVKTDDRPWCNPATWLNQHRWEDQPATGPPRTNGHKARPQTLREQTADVVQSLDPSGYPRPDDARAGQSDFAPAPGGIPQRRAH